ncbi:dirigent protein 9-like [Chenopodium quinoa]|uniref:Dirigent protein n=1 Tax=Chenopodium quinoa TaxID=63459 RepID=A0A803MVN6_CHEQI|nr:dirigent protein 9-like [Chenopodium quinoa]
MAKFFSLPTICILLLSLTLGLANSARILDQMSSQFTPADELPSLPPMDDSSSTTVLPSGQAPAVATEAPAAAAETPDAAAEAPVEEVATPDNQPDQPQPDSTTTAAATPEEAPAASAAQGGAGGGAEQPGHPAISFFMHDVLGGSSASGRIVTGLIASSDVNGIPFSQPNNQVFPVSNGIPLMNNGNLNNVLNNNNVPSFAGLNGQNQQQVVQNAGNNNVVNGGNNNQAAFVNPGQLPSGTTLQKLLFGSITVIDDELTEGHELGSGVMGRGQGFYLASSLDGESHTMAFTAIFHGEGHEQETDDTISFFGVHRTASPISQMAVIGGTGKYENAKGYTTIETIPDQNQHTTDGVDTVAHFSVYLN